MRLAVWRAVAVETARGWRIAKDKQSHKIDVVVALGMAALAAVRAQSESTYHWEWVDDIGGAVPEQSTGRRLLPWGGMPLIIQRMRQKNQMRDYCIEMGFYFDEQGKLRRRVARDREVVRVPLDRGSRGRFALVQQGRQTSRRLGSSFMLSTRHQSRRRGREFARLAHHQGKTGA